MRSLPSQDSVSTVPPLCQWLPTHRKGTGVCTNLRVRAAPLSKTRSHRNPWWGIKPHNMRLLFHTRPHRSAYGYRQHLSLLFWIRGVEGGRPPSSVRANERHITNYILSVETHFAGSLQRDWGELSPPSRVIYREYNPLSPASLVASATFDVVCQSNLLPLAGCTVRYCAHY